MKKNSSNFRKGFRKLDNKEVQGHPTYIYAKVGNEYKYLGLTHSNITNNVKNIKLEKNPNPKDSRTSYVRPNAGKANRSEFGKQLNGWHFSEQDKKKVNKIIEKNEKKKPRKNSW
ncbi:MAG: hypothetical protein IKA54_05220 [Clostridia bacterium]|nr:hypothetical protein [Clostridia bacterium]